jgi:hypothetical protein
MRARCGPVLLRDVNNGCWRGRMRAYPQPRHHPSSMSMPPPHFGLWWSRTPCCHPLRCTPYATANASYADGVLEENEFRGAPRRSPWPCWTGLMRARVCGHAVRMQSRISILGSRRLRPPQWGLSTWMPSAPAATVPGLEGQDLHVPGFTGKLRCSDLSGSALRCEPRHTDQPPMRP